MKLIKGLSDQIIDNIHISCKFLVWMQLKIQICPNIVYDVRTYIKSRLEE